MTRLRAALAARDDAADGRRVRWAWLVALAAIGASLLLIIVATEWQKPNDEFAYWSAAARLWSGQPLYDPAAAPNTPYAYWYPPPLAQLLAPLTSVVSSDAFSVAWTILLLGCLWWLAGRNLLVALACIAFLPVAVELRVRNVHLLIAVLAVLALRRSWAFWVAAAAIKITPVLGMAYLVAAGRWRDALRVGVLGLAVIAVSYVLAPNAWADFYGVVGTRAGADGGSVLPIPFWLRFLIGAGLAILGGRLERGARRGGFTPRLGQSAMIFALTIANPTLWVTALSLLIALVPLWRSDPVRATVQAPAAPPKPEMSAA